MSESSFCLDNGLTIATDTMDNIETVAVSVLLKSGSRSENKENNGISHFLEHMAFKGTTTRSAKSIAEEFDNIGGYFNAYTSRERTVYYTKVLKGDVPLAVDILSDILQNSTYSEDEMEKEKGVIIQEIAQTEDTPDDLIFDHFQEVAYPDQPFGRSILGTVDFIKGVTRNQVIDFVNSQYHYNNIIIAGAGNLDPKVFSDLVTEKFTNFSKQPPSEVEGARYVGGERKTIRDLEQVHVVIGLKALSYLDPDYYTQQVLSIIAGGGMSSRLFQEVREKRGLAYAISSFTSSYSDSGIFGVYSGTAENNVNELIEVICAELLKLTHDVKSEELMRAKAQVRAGLLMSQESSVSRAEKLAGNYAAYGRYIPTLEVIEKIEAIDLKDITKLAVRMLTQKISPTLISIGKVDKVFTLSDIVKKLEL